MTGGDLSLKHFVSSLISCKGLNLKNNSNKTTDLELQGCAPFRIELRIPI